MSDIPLYLDKSNQAAPEELSLEQISLNAERDLLSVLDFSDFVRVSAIFAGSKYAKNGLYRALKDRSSDPSRNAFLKSKVAHAERVGCGLLREEFDWFFRHYVVLLCVSFESFLRSHMLISRVVDLKLADLDKSKAIKDLISLRDLKGLKRSVDSLWKEASEDRYVLLKDLAENAKFVYARLLPQYVDYSWMNHDRHDSTNKLILIRLAKSRYKDNLLLEEDFRILSDFFLLRNAIVHNGSIAKEQLNFHEKTFFAGDLISLSSKDIYFFAETMRKYKNYFPVNPEF